MKHHPDAQIAVTEEPSALAATVDSLEERFERLRQEHAGGAARPIGSYAVLLVVYSACFLALLLSARRARRLRGLTAVELALGAVSTFRLARLVTKDSITSAFRAPFTTFEEAEGEGEVAESPRGSGVRHAMGELLTCPFCISMWVAMTFGFGFLLFPRVTRLVAGVLTIVTASDTLQRLDQVLRQVALDDDPASS